MIAINNERCGCGPCDGHNGPNGQVDPFGGDHQCHAKAQQRRRRTTIEHINQVAKQTAVFQLNFEKIVENH